MNNYTDNSKKMSVVEITHYDLKKEKLEEQLKNLPIQKPLEPVIKRRKKFLKFSISAVLYIMLCNAVSLIPKMSVDERNDDGGGQICPDEYYNNEELYQDEENLIP